MIAVVVLYLAGIVVFAARTRHRNRIERFYHRETGPSWYDAAIAVGWPAVTLFAFAVVLVTRASRFSVGGRP